MVPTVQAERIEPHEDVRADDPPADSAPAPISPDVALGATLDAISRWWDGGAGFRRSIDSIREWWDGGEGLMAFLETADAQIILFRRRRDLGETWWCRTAGQRLEDGSMWIFEVYVQYGSRKCIVAEFRTRGGAEKFAQELREEISSAGDNSF